MKINLTYLFAGLLGSVASAQAQVSQFSVCSDTLNSGPYHQHVGMIASENALVKITSTGGLIYNGFTHVVGNYYTVPANTGATVYSTAANGIASKHAITEIENVTSSSLGYNTENLIANLSGRFFLEAPQDDGELPCPDVPDGTASWSRPAKISFTVGSGSYFSVDIWGEDNLAQFGLIGASMPVVDGPNGTYSGEGNFSLGYLEPGPYKLLVKLHPNSTNGIVVVSVNAQ